MNEWNENIFILLSEVGEDTWLEDFRISSSLQQEARQFTEKEDWDHTTNIPVT